MLVSCITLGSFAALVNRNTTSFCTSKLPYAAREKLVLLRIAFSLCGIAPVGVRSCGQMCPAVEGAVLGRFSR